jgi:hypothetical protein
MPGPSDLRLPDIDIDETTPIDWGGFPPHPPEWGRWYEPGVKDHSKPGDRRRQVEAMREAEARLQNLLAHQYAHREETRREAAAAAIWGTDMQNTSD